MHVDRFLFVVAFRKVVPSQQLSDRHLAAKIQNSGEVHLREPVTIAVYFRSTEIDDFSDLFEIVASVRLNLLFGQSRRTGCVASTGIADQRGVIPNDNDGLMAEFLKLSDLPQGHGVPEVDVDASGVDAILDAEWSSRIATLLQFCGEFFFRDNLFDAATDNGKLFFNRRKLHGGGGRSRTNNDKRRWPVALRKRGQESDSVASIYKALTRFGMGLPTPETRFAERRISMLGYGFQRLLRARNRPLALTHCFSCGSWRCSRVDGAVVQRFGKRIDGSPASEPSHDPTFAIPVSINGWDAN